MVRCVCVLCFGHMRNRGGVSLEQQILFQGSFISTKMFCVAVCQRSYYVETNTHTHTVDSTSVWVKWKTNRLGSLQLETLQSRFLLLYLYHVQAKTHGPTYSHEMFLPFTFLKTSHAASYFIIHGEKIKSPPNSRHNSFLFFLLSVST